MLCVFQLTGNTHTQYVQECKYSLALAAFNEQYKTNISCLKCLQEKALDVLTSGKDCVCSLPTGYGKSLIYELLPFVNANCLVIIIVPLNAIIAQEVQKLGEAAMCLSKKSDLSKIVTGTIKYLYAHPEDIVNNRKLIELFRCESLKKVKIYLVVDEAHCILDWGDNFRPDYKKISSLRSVFPCQILALSATVTESGQKIIMTNLLMKDCETVCASPTKSNIELIVLKRPSAVSKGNSASTPYDYVFEHVLHELSVKGEDFPVTVIYCKSIQWIGYGYEMAREVLGDSFYAGDNKPENARVVMFHSSMEDNNAKLKNMILESLQRPQEESSIRLIFASVALGMGADLKHVRRVIHAGPPSTLETYIQEIGRCGRAGTHSQAILYYNNSDLGLQHMQRTMKDYCKTDRCKRELVNEYFGFLNTDKPTFCCNICHTDLGLEWDFSKLSISDCK